MRKVFKYQFNILDGQPVTMPVGARIVASRVQVTQGDNACFVWAEVDPEETRMEPRFLILRGTGHDVPDEALFVSTTFDQEFVWHLYEIPSLFATTQA